MRLRSDVGARRFPDSRRRAGARGDGDAGKLLVYMRPHAKFRGAHLTMADADIEVSPTGPFGEGGPERPAEDTPSASYSRDTAQHFFRRRQGEPKDTAREGTADHVPMIDRPRAQR